MSKEDLKKQERVDLVLGQDPAHSQAPAEECEDDTRSHFHTDQFLDNDTIAGNETMLLEEKAPAKESAADEKNASAASETTIDNLIGQTIAGRFQILDKLGEGGMSVVYKARHLMLNRVVAVKLIKPGLMQDKAAMRFQQEAKAATSLNHNNIATVREFGYDDNGAYLVMDFVEGVPLDAAIKQDTVLEEGRTKKIVSQICEGLKHAHEAGVVHRDLKPANIILSRNANGEEVPKIVDFGIAKFVDEENQANLTQTGEVFGTPNYMSPEQCLGKRADARSDIYSLGCVAYECLTGKPPFVADSALEVLMKHSNEEFTAPKKHQAKTLMKAIQGCLEKNPDDRWQTVEDLRQFINDPDGPAKKKYKKLETHFSKLQIVKISLTLSALIIVGMTALQIAPVLKAIFAPNPWTQIARAAEVSATYGQVNYQTAEVDLKKALKMAQENHANAQDLEDIYLKLAQLQSKMDKWGASKKNFAQALLLNEKHDEDFNRGSIHDWLAEIYLQEKNYPKAIEEAKSADKIKERVVGYGNKLAILPLLRLGQAYRGNNELQKAEEVDRKIIPLVEKLFPTKNDLMVSDAYKQLGNILLQQGKSSEGLTYYKKEVAVLANVLGKDDPRTVERVREVFWEIKTKDSEAEAKKFWKEFGAQPEKD